MLAGYRTFLCDLACKSLRETVEGAGKMLGFLEIGRVPNDRFVKGPVEYESACLAECEVKVAAGKGVGFSGRVQQDATMHRDGFDPVD
ncbi:hypothetical protein [Mesorhizobium escarrei]|uniref:hypothetical protein n=1 Tax=Mesorhizobium escarrei TaxID=666018 RepID=UPI0020A74B21|nr:hypothetical protein [Mesorhizobium escarrei]